MFPSRQVSLVLQSAGRLLSPAPMVAVSKRSLMKPSSALDSKHLQQQDSSRSQSNPNLRQVNSTLRQPNSTLIQPNSALSSHALLQELQEIYLQPKEEEDRQISNENFEDSSADVSIDVPGVRTLPKQRSKLRGVYSSDPYSNDHLPRLPVGRFKDTSILDQFTYQGEVKVTKLSKYMQLLSPSHNNAQAQDGQIESSKPLVIIYPWLMAKEKHVEKYTRLYTDLGMHVLRVSITPHDLLRPVPRSHVAAIELLEYLLDNKYWDKLLLHGLSVGAYGFMEVMTKMEENEDRYLQIRPRFQGQIWDSPCDLPGLKEGVARSISNSRTMQIKIMDLLDWFLKVRYEAATRHYVKTQDMYHKNYLNAPSLFLFSRADPVASPVIVSDLADAYHASGHEVFSQVFNESGHVGHFAKYRTDYKANVMAFLEHIGMMEHAGIYLNQHDST